MRSRLSRGLLFVLVGWITFSTQLCSAQSQNEAAVLRGQGAYLQGLGWHNLNTAAARSIEADTVMRWNADLRMIEAERRELKFRAAEGKQLKIEEIKKQLERRLQLLRSEPTSDDIKSGEALNVLLFDLTDPALSPSQWQEKPVNLPEGTVIKNVIFSFTLTRSAINSSERLAKGVIALARLDVSNWPSAMKLDSLKAERDAYRTAYEFARDELIAGHFGQLDGSLRKLDASLQSLDAKVSTLPKDRGFREEANRFVQSLKAATVMFDAATQDYAREILSETRVDDARTVRELVAFTRKYRLQFADSKSDLTGRAGELYLSIFHVLKEQANALNLRTTAPLEAMGKEAAVPVGAIAPVGTTWTGDETDLVTQKTWNVEYSVKAHDKDKMTLVYRGAGGAIWEMTCRFSAQSNFDILSIRRIKGNINIPVAQQKPLNGAKGKGVVAQNKLHVDYNWPASKTSRSYVGNMQPQAQPPQK